MRRSELAALGIQLPVLPTIVLGPLPGGAGWSARLARLGLDVTASGAAEDTPATLDEARAAAPHLPLKARTADPSWLAGRGPLVLEGPPGAPEGVHPLLPGDAVVVPIDAGDEVEAVMEVARRVLGPARARPASELWVATPGDLGRLPGELVERKLEALVEGTRQARLYLAKDQFDHDDPGPAWGPGGYHRVG
ncbi:MAG: hypothetical protein AB7V42_08060 [Thermoleophilia bacterium]